MKISRLRPLGALALSVTLCGGLFTMSATQAATKSTTKAARPAPPNPLDKILSKLSLTSAQKTAIKTIIEAANAQIKALNEDTTLTDAEKMTAHKAICDEAFAKIEALLTADQKTIFDAWLAAQPAPRPAPPTKKTTTDGSTTTDGDSHPDCPKGDKPKPPKRDKPTPPTTTPTATPTPTDSSNSS